MALSDAQTSGTLRYGREVGRAGCFVFAEALSGDGAQLMAQHGVPDADAELVVRRLERQVSIATELRDRAVGPFSFWSQSQAVGVWPDDGLRPLLNQWPAGPGAAGELVSRLMQIAEAVHDLHVGGWVHGALYPMGVWVDWSGGRVRFADFSLAFGVGKHSQSRFSLPSWNLISFADGGRLSPEQTGRISVAPDERADCHGLGTLFGALLKLGGSAGTEVPERLQQLVERMTARHPSERPSSMSVVLGELRALQANREAHAWMPDLSRTPIAAGPAPRLRIEPAGRDEALAELRRHWAEGKGLALAICGPSGIGKTELSRLFLDEVSLAGVVVATAKGDPARQMQPLYVLRRIFRNLQADLQSRGPGEVARVRDRLISTLAEDAELLAATLPEAASLLGVARDGTALVSPRDTERFAGNVLRFVRAVAAACGSVCLVFDDMQWVDESSLEVIERLVAEVDASALFVLLLARTTSDRPVPAVVAAVTNLDLGPISPEGVQAIIDRTFGSRLARSQEFARQLHTISGGNPLHITQALHQMASRNRVFWDPATGVWQWSSLASGDHVVGDDVLELIGERIGALEPQVRDVLRAAGSLADTFDSTELAVVIERPNTDIESALSTAAGLGLVTAGEGGDEEHLQWRFIHDQVRLAAQRDVPEGQRNGLRHRVGLRLLAGFDGEELRRREFTIVERLDDYPPDRLGVLSRLRLADLTISVGIDSRRRLDFERAVQHLDRGATLLPQRRWEEARDQAIRLTTEYIYCAFSRGDSRRVDALFGEALENLADPLEAVRFHKLRVVLETQSQRYPAALRAAAAGLRQLGVRMPVRRTGGMVASAIELVRVFALLGRRPLGKLENLKEPGDARHQAAIDLIGAVLPAAYFVAPELMLAGGLKMLRLSMRHGRARGTPIGEVLYGLSLGAFFGAHGTGYALGELALRKAAESGDAAVENQAILIHAAFVRFWAKPFIEDEPLLRRGYELARQAGDMLFANFHILGLMSHGLARGMPLGELQDFISWGEDLIRRSRDSFSLETIIRWRDVVSMLRGLAPPDGVIPASLARRTEGPDSNTTSECYRRVMLCQYCWFIGDTAGALKAGREAERILWRSPGHLVLIEHAFFYGLALADASGRSRPGRRMLRLRLGRVIRRMERWARNAPETFLGRLLLLQAERRALGRRTDAVALYERAIDEAERAGNVNVAALASERAATYLRQLGAEAAALGYFKKAHELYGRWGAATKLQALERDVPALRPITPAPSHAGDPVQVSSALQAARALLSRSDPAELVGGLLGFVIRTCGADFAAYASVESGDVIIEADVRGTNDAVPVGLPPETADSASPAVLRFAAAMGEEIAGNLAADRRFARCRRLSSVQPAAVCCIPVMRGREVSGLIYAERVTGGGAFAAPSLDTLHMLAANLTATLENVQVTRALKARSAELSESARRMALVEAAKLQLAKFVPDIVRREIEANPQAPGIDARPRDVTVLFLDIAGYTNLNERLSPQEAQKLIERSFSRLLDSIYKWGGEICESTGDGLIVFFSSDDAVEHACDAASSAAAMREEVRNLNVDLGGESVRVVVNFGLNSGIGAVGSTRLEGASRSRWIYTVNGQVVNIAARIVGEAKDGAILVGPETQRRIQGRFATRSVGRRRLKGISVDVELFAVDAARPAPDRRPVDQADAGS